MLQSNRPQPDLVNEWHPPVDPPAQPAPEELPDDPSPREYPDRPPESEPVTPVEMPPAQKLTRCIQLYQYGGFLMLRMDCQHGAGRPTHHVFSHTADNHMFQPGVTVCTHYD
jgi:hypothetical protein